MRNIWLLIILGASLLLAAAGLTRGHIWGDDFASYIMQAESILNGTTDQFVEHNAFTIFESSSQIGPVAYPWGYPLILAPVLALKGIHPLALKLPALFFFAGFLICLYFLLRTRLPKTETLLIVSLFAFSPLMLQFLDQILSDIPFLFFSTLALYLMIRGNNERPRDSILPGAIIACAFFIRTTGVLLLAAFLLWKAWEAWQHRTDREFLIDHIGKPVLVVVGTFLGLWILYAVIFPGGGESYFAQYRDFQIRSIPKTLYSYLLMFGRFFGESIAWNILFTVLFVFFLIGAVMLWKQDLLLILFFVLWLLLLGTWPFLQQGARFIFPLLPIFIYFTVQGMRYFIGKLPAQYARFGSFAFYGVWGAIILFFLYSSTMFAYANLKNGRAINGPFDSYSQDVYNYIKNKTQPNSVIVFFKPRAMRLMTGRDAIMSTECELILTGNFLVLSRKVGDNQQIPPEEIGACDLPLEEVFKNTRFVVYKINK